LAKNRLETHITSYTYINSYGSTLTVDPAPRPKGRMDDMTTEDFEKRYRAEGEAVADHLRRTFCTRTLAETVKALQENHDIRMMSQK